VLCMIAVCYNLPISRRSPHSIFGSWRYSWQRRVSSGDQDLWYQLTHHLNYGFATSLKTYINYSLCFSLSNSGVSSTTVISHMHPSLRPGNLIFSHMDIK